MSLQRTIFTVIPFRVAGSFALNDSIADWKCDTGELSVFRDTYTVVVVCLLTVVINDGMKRLIKSEPSPEASGSNTIPILNCMLLLFQRSKVLSYVGVA